MLTSALGHRRNFDLDDWSFIDLQCTLLAGFVAIVFAFHSLPTLPVTCWLPNSFILKSPLIEASQRGICDLILLSIIKFKILLFWTCFAGFHHLVGVWYSHRQKCWRFVLECLALKGALRNRECPGWLSSCDKWFARTKMMYMNCTPFASYERIVFMIFWRSHSMIVVVRTAGVASRNTNVSLIRD